MALSLLLGSVVMVQLMSMPRAAHSLRETYAPMVESLGEELGLQQGPGARCRIWAC